MQERFPTLQRQTPGLSRYAEAAWRVSATNLLLFVGFPGFRTAVITGFRALVKVVDCNVSAISHAFSSKLDSSGSELHLRASPFFRSVLLKAVMCCQRRSRQGFGQLTTAGASSELRKMVILSWVMQCLEAPAIPPPATYY